MINWDVVLIQIKYSSFLSSEMKSVVKNPIWDFKGENDTVCGARQHSSNPQMLYPIKKICELFHVFKMVLQILWLIDVPTRKNCIKHTYAFY